MSDSTMGLSALEMCEHSTVEECYFRAYEIHDELVKVGLDTGLILGVIYRAGVIDGKRQERAKRKDGVRA